MCAHAELTWDAQGNPIEGIGTVQDITESKRAEEQIIEQARMLELAHDAIMVRDLEDYILYWNQSAERIFGWTVAETTGRKLGEVLPKDESNTLKYEEAKKTVLETGNWQGEFITRTKSGRQVILESRWTLMCDDHGTPRSILGINTDVTEKKRFETQLLRAQRMESIGALAGGIAHDLNNILTPLMISVQVLKERIGDDADGKKLLAALESNVERGAKLVKQVLTFGRGAQSEHVPINPKHIAREIKQIIDETFPKSVEFVLENPADLWAINGDAMQVYQVLLNLCVNARDAMPDGGKLSLCMANMMLDETTVGMNLEAQPGPYVLVTVTDTGTGIPQEVKDKIFDPFFTTKQPGKGTGLGLSTALAIVANHKGFITCQSEEGKGAVFKVYFPANRAAATADSHRKRSLACPEATTS